jgi:hypothetical protein
MEQIASFGDYLVALTSVRQRPDAVPSVICTTGGGVQTLVGRFRPDEGFVAVRRTFVLSGQGAHVRVRTMGNLS